MSELATMKRWAAVALAAGLLSAAPAWAQLAQNSDAPVDMTADELAVVHAQCLAIWRGSAEALQDNSRLRADILKIYNKSRGPAKPGATNQSCGALDHMEAQGNVFYVTPQQRVRGNAATYEAGSDTITFTGDVVAAQGQNVIRGERLVITVSTGQAQMQTDVKGRNKPGRVRGVFYPNQHQTAANPAAPR
jgi:lipopolysaccharide export system protein LptA